MNSQRKFNLLNSDYLLEDDTIRDFSDLVISSTDYCPRDVSYINCPQLLQPVPVDESHIQIVYRGDIGTAGHWTCVFYNNNVIRVYDSIFRDLSPLQSAYIDSLFPYKPPIVFVDVQKQENQSDCGVFAIAFATSLLNRKNPAFENYVVNEMRPHLVSILESGQLLPFPSRPRKPRGSPQRNIFSNLVKHKEREKEKKRKQRGKNTMNIVETSTINSRSLNDSMTVEKHDTKSLKRRLSANEIRENNVKRKRASRCNPEVTSREKERNKIGKRVTRSNTKSYREVEQVRDAAAHRVAREDEEFRKSEQVRNTEAHRVAREDEEFRKSEQVRNSQARHIARENSEYRSQENSLASARKECSKSNWDKICEKFWDNVSEGHTNVCHCCGRLWHKKSVRNISKRTLMSKSSKYTKEYLENIFHLDPQADVGSFCHTCANNIRDAKIPRLARCNGLVFPDIPAELSDLTPLEERLVCPRHIFLKIIRKGRGLGYQHGLDGCVVNVPVEFNTMVTALPRCSSDNNVICVELKRKMCYKHGRKERIRPQKVREAARYLVQCELFKQLKIQLDKNWTENEVSEDDVCTCNVVCGDDLNEEPEQEVNPGGEETLLDQDMTLIMAPGEGKRPLSLVFDEHMEELGFVKIHCGQKRALKGKLSHMDVIKSEISREDRRAVRPDYLFTALKKQQMICVKNSISTCLRKKSLKGVPILAENVLDCGYVDSLVQHDDAFRVLQGVKNSPSHWEAEKKKLLAMVRQFGVPTLFITLSAAETRWLHLLRILKLVVDHEDITLEDADSLPYDVKARLIQADPYICATYFDNRLQEIRRTWESTSGPFGSHAIAHFYYRIEFQHRGSPHAHIMLWLEGAPVFDPADETSTTTVAAFVDEIISCSNEGIDEDLFELQRHRHSHTCHPKPGRPCRFGIPFFPMDETQLLTELPKDDPLYKKSKELGKQLHDQLGELPSDLLTFEDFLRFVKIGRDDYILAVRASLSRPKVLLKRGPRDVFINPYCRKIIQLQRANMDAQYILDPFACSVYIVNYINKADRGMSRLLKAAADEAHRGNKGIRESLRAVSNVFLNASEISAQEAVYYLVSLPLSRCSESEIFINTSPPENRVHMLKSFQDLKNMDPQSPHIFMPNLIDHYVNRPNNPYFEDMTLAYFAAYFTYSKYSTKRTALDEQENVDVESENEVGEMVVQGNSIALLNKDGYIKRRTKPRIIRFCRYNRCQDPDNFYREQLMLYLPWRNEELQLLDSSLDLKSKFYENFERLKRESTPFNQLGGGDEFDSLLAALREINVERMNEEDEHCRGAMDEDRPLEGYEYELQVGDVADDIVPGGNPGPNQGGEAVGIIRQPAPLSEDEFLHFARKLNKEQRDILLHITHHFRVSCSPLHIFVSGGAGVGKSVFIKALYQSLTLYLNSEPGSNPDDLKILLAAPTGKAAFGIGGQTLHSALGLPVSQAGYAMSDLSPSVANTFACKLAHLKLLIIDEISMVGSRTFHQVHRRLQQIFHSTEYFGKISVIVVGDLRQLSPVGDNWIFQPNVGNNPLAVLAGSPLWDLFQLFELNTVMRQRDDLMFATALNNLAAGTMTVEDVQLMASRTFKLADLPSDADGAVHLYSANKQVDEHNERVLSLMVTEGATVDAIDEVFGEPNESAKERALKSVLSLPTTQTYGLTRRLFLKVSARYMVTVNVDTADGLVNGTTGKLRAIDYGVNTRTGVRRPLRVWLEFDEVEAGKNKRTAMNHSLSLYRERLNKQWTPLESVSYVVKRWKASNLQVRRTQFPLVPAEAITVHKSQGATMDKVVVHLSPYFKRAMLYVACSRARTANGLFIVSEKDFSPPIKAPESSPVVAEMCRLRNSPLQTQFQFLRLERPAEVVQVYFHNVQSLRKHLADVSVDPTVAASDVIFLVETWGCPQDAFCLDGFAEVARNNGPKLSCANPGYGSIAFVRNYVSQTVSLSSCKSFMYGGESEGHCEGVYLDLDNVRLVGVYRSPKCHIEVLLQALNVVLFEPERKVPLPPTVVFGDFNCDLLQTAENKLLKFFDHIGFRSHLSQVATTRGRTQIDNVFSNINATAGVYESLFSYHKPVWMRYNFTEIHN